MKNLALIICLFGTTLGACSNDIPIAEVPSVVLNTFQTDFPAAKKLEWEKIKGNYEVEFELNGIEQHAQFATDGRKLMHKKEIPEGSLPAVISSLLKDQFSSYLIDDVQQIMRAEITYYQVELERKGKPDRKIVFSADGKENSALPYWD